MWPRKPKIITIWLFEERFADSSSRERCVGLFTKCPELDWTLCSVTKGSTSILAQCSSNICGKKKALGVLCFFCHTCTPVGS